MNYVDHFWDILGPPKYPGKQFLESTAVKIQFYTVFGDGSYSVMSLGSFDNFWGVLDPS